MYHDADGLWSQEEAGLCTPPGLCQCHESFMIMMMTLRNCEEWTECVLFLTRCWWPNDNCAGLA